MKAVFIFWRNAARRIWSKIDDRLTVTEKETTANKERIDRVVEIMLRELPINGIKK